MEFEFTMLKVILIFSRAWLFPSLKHSTFLQGPTKYHTYSGITGVTGPGGAKEGFVYLYTRTYPERRPGDDAVMSTEISFPSESS